MGSLTDGLASIPVVDAVAETARAECAGARLVFGLDANTHVTHKERGGARLVEPSARKRRQVSKLPQNYHKTTTKLPQNYHKTTTKLPQNYTQTGKKSQEMG